jgi:UDP-2,4-diacetamido-2,4,6-trideoxy-beta-L-altropyranose hydrolase
MVSEWTKPSKEGLCLRLATSLDCRRLFEWRNHPQIIATTTSGKGVNPIEHRQWFEDLLTRADRRLYIVEIDGTPAGQTRFDARPDGYCVISVYLIPEFGRRGLGVAAIRLGCDLIFQMWSAKGVLAYVRPDNPEGQRAFLRAGFRAVPPDAGCPKGHVAFVRRAD